MGRRRSMAVVRWRIVDLCQWLFAEFRLSAPEMTMSRELPPDAFCLNVQLNIKSSGRLDRRFSSVTGNDLFSSGWWTRPERRWRQWY